MVKTVENCIVVAVVGVVGLVGLGGGFSKVWFGLGC
jgi:hypothetical protein